MTPGVDCRADGDGWICTVTIGDDAHATVHEVRIDPATRDDLGSGVAVDELVSASIAFLLEREPREAILRRFDLPVIARYFPEYPAEIRRRLGG